MFDVTCRQEVGAQFQERCPTEASRAYAACLLARLRASFGAIFSRPLASDASGHVLELISTGSTLRMPSAPAIGVETQPIFLRYLAGRGGPAHDSASRKMASRGASNGRGWVRGSYRAGLTA